MEQVKKFTTIKQCTDCLSAIGDYLTLEYADKDTAELLDIIGNKIVELYNMSFVSNKKEENFMKHHVFKLMTKYDEPNDRDIIITKEEMKKATDSELFKAQVSHGCMYIVLDNTPSSEFHYNIATAENVVGRVLSIDLDKNIADAEINMSKLYQICSNLDLNNFGLLIRAVGTIDDKKYAHNINIFTYQLCLLEERGNKDE